MAGGALDQPPTAASVPIGCAREGVPPAHPSDLWTYIGAREGGGLVGLAFGGGGGLGAAGRLVTAEEVELVVLLKTPHGTSACGTRASRGHV